MCAGVVMLLDFTVRGIPTPAGSKSPAPVYAGSGADKHWTGKTRMIDGKLTPKSQQARKSWRGAVREAVADAMTEITDGTGRDPFPLDYPLTVGMVFTFARPATHFGTGRNRALVKASAPHAPMGKPDLIKLVRAVEDEITGAGLWRDDARVVSYFRLAKVYVGDPLAMTAPGVRVAIRAHMPAIAAEQAALL